jgi:MFS family permease
MQRLMIILWPSFLVASAAVGLFFAAIDPHELVLFGSFVPEDRMKTYTIAFFVIWIFTALASLLTYYLQSTQDHHSHEVA